MPAGNLTPPALAVLAEIAAAVNRLAETGQPHTLFINKMALAPNDRAAIYAFLGLGQVSIELKDTHEPAEWRESGISGVWYGVFYDYSNRPILETIEICTFPILAAAQAEDVAGQRQVLHDRLAELRSLNAER